MTQKEKPKYGTIGWIDLTVPDALSLKDFYSEVAGWQPEALSMGDYDDFIMSADGEPKAGVCHKKGPNSDIPSQWMIYINVPDLDKSLAACTAKGGKAITAIKGMGNSGRYCFIEDPAGAVCALFEPKVD
ncbi:MAG: glyoxalase [Cytophagales bacterium CG12_big_fil_rev_8_21_14_0_65_40_12]|nr:MAG: glyoxalase [Cytophagales bacterium CG12_big_fil_rev_8_21_14_0_65_40_12]PIW04976.1 MAG: glyoxalase [Cytophagales bacterium CG17_big_fil_post_rev_8_21_14_2_50_40_13]